MAHQIGCGGGRRLWRRRPDLGGFFIAQIDGLCRHVGDRIVAPTGQPVLAAVHGPRVACSGLGDQAAKVGVGDDVDPGRGRHFAGMQIDDVLAVGVEAAQSVVELEIRGRVSDGAASRSGSTGQRRLKDGQGWLMALQPGHLFGQGAIGAVEYDAGNGMEQRSIRLVHLIFTQHKDTATLIQPTVAVGALNQPVDEIVHGLPIVRRLAIEDHQVDAKTAATPVGVRPQQILEQFRLCLVVNAQEQDGVIAGDAKGPQPGLPFAVGVEGGCSPPAARHRDRAIATATVASAPAWASSSPTGAVPVPPPSGHGKRRGRRCSRRDSAAPDPAQPDALGRPT